MGNRTSHKKKKSLKDSHHIKRSNSAYINTLEYNEINEIPTELKKFQNIFPCLLKANSNGEIECFNSCLKEIPKHKIQFNEENKYSANECLTNLSIIDDIDYSIGISVLLNDSKFGLLLSDSKKASLNYSSKSIIVKKKIYSISIKEEDICINDFYKKKLESIANNNELDDLKKAEKLDVLLKNAGFLVPLKAYIGGSYIFNCEKMSDNQKKDLLLNIKLDLNIFNCEFNMKKKLERTKTSSQINCFQIGGSTNKPMKEWIESIDLKNSHIIEYSELRGIDSFIDDKIKAKLEKPIALVWQKYRKRYNFLKVIEELRKKVVYYNYTDLENFKCGICDTNYPDIYVYKKDSFYSDSKFLTCVTKDIFSSFQSIIVGIEIINKCEKHEYGHFTLKKNPILRNELNIKFTSARGESMKFDIKVYLMKFPD